MVTVPFTTNLTGSRHIAFITTEGFSVEKKRMKEREKERQIDRQIKVRKEEGSEDQ